MTLKIISVMLISCFALEQVSFANPDLKVSKIELFFKALPDLGIPESVARVEDADQNFKKTVYLIQDAHTNTSGQLHLAETLRILLEKEPLIRHLFVEAGAGDSSLSKFRLAGTPEQRKRIAEPYLRSGELHGEEYLDLVSSRPFTIWGVEDPELYKKAVTDYRLVAQDREKFLRYLEDIQASLNMLKSQLYNPLLLSFDRQAALYRKNEMPLTDYFTVLSERSQVLALKLDLFPELKSLKKIKDKESRIDFKKANEEEARALEALSPEDQKEILGFMLQQQAPSKISTSEHKEHEAFYALFEEKLSARGVAVHKSYPDLSEYFEYLKMVKKLDAQKIFKEIKMLETRIYETLSLNEDERTLRHCQDAVYLFEKLFKLSLTPEDYQEYLLLTRDFGIRQLTGFVNQKIIERGEHYSQAVLLREGYSETVRRAEDFYRLTYERDIFFVDRLSEKMRESGDDRAILIAGGFHGPNLKTLLKQRNISYVSIVPQVLNETDQARYEKILLETEKFIRPSAAAPGTGTARTPALMWVSDAPFAQKFLAEIQGLAAARLASKPSDDLERPEEKPASSPKLLNAAGFGFFVATVNVFFGFSAVSYLSFFSNPLLIFVMGMSFLAWAMAQGIFINLVLERADHQRYQGDPEKDAKEIFGDLKLLAQSKKDATLTAALELTDGFSLTSTYGQVLQGGKKVSAQPEGLSGISRQILITPLLLSFRKVAYYLAIRRALGFQYDLQLGRIRERAGETFLMRYFPRLFWEVYSDYESMKRAGYYGASALFILPYIFIHAMIFTSFAIVASSASVLIGFSRGGVRSGRDAYQVGLDLFKNFILKDLELERIEPAKGPADAAPGYLKFLAANLVSGTFLGSLTTLSTLPVTDSVFDRNSLETMIFIGLVFGGISSLYSSQIRSEEEEKRGQGARLAGPSLLIEGATDAEKMAKLYEEWKFWLERMPDSANSPRPSFFLSSDDEKTSENLTVHFKDSNGKWITKKNKRVYLKIDLFNEDKETVSDVISAGIPGASELMLLGSLEWLRRRGFKRAEFPIYADRHGRSFMADQLKKWALEGVLSEENILVVDEDERILVIENLHIENSPLFRGPPEQGARLADRQYAEDLLGKDLLDLFAAQNPSGVLSVVRITRALDDPSETPLLAQFEEKLEKAFDRKPGPEDYAAFLYTRHPQDPQVSAEHVIMIDRLKNLKKRLPKKAPSIDRFQGGTDEGFVLTYSDYANLHLRLHYIALAKALRKAKTISKFFAHWKGFLRNTYGDQATISAEDWSGDSDTASGPTGHLMRKYFRAVHPDPLKKDEGGVLIAAGIYSDIDDIDNRGGKMLLFGHIGPISAARLAVERVAWYHRPVKTELDSKLLMRNLNEIRESLQSIHHEIDDPEHYLEEEHLAPEVIRNYGKAIRRLNSTTLHHHHDTPHQLEEEYKKLHALLGTGGYIETAGEYSDPERGEEVKRIFEFIFSDRVREVIETRHDGAIDVAAKVFVALVNLQPFHDGNKRTANLIMNYILMKSGYTPFLLNADNAAEYAQIVYRYDEDVKISERDFRDFLEENVEKAGARLADEAPETAFLAEWKRWAAGAEELGADLAGLMRDLRADSPDVLVVEKIQGKLKALRSHLGVFFNFSWPETLLADASLLISNVLTGKLLRALDSALQTEGDAAYSNLPYLGPAVQDLFGQIQRISRILEKEGIGALWRYYQPGGTLPHFDISPMVFKEEAGPSAARLAVNPLIESLITEKKSGEIRRIAEKLGLDLRTYDQGLLDVSYIGFDMAVKKAVNPGNKNLTALYAGSGADVSNFLLSTNATRAYFVDQVRVSIEKLTIAMNLWEGLDVLISGLNTYSSQKFSHGHAVTGFDGLNDISDKIIYELKALGVEKKSIAISKPLLNSGSVVVRFDWAYPGQKKKRYTITFINADIANPREYPADLEKALSKKIDIYYQRAGYAISSLYDAFMDDIASSVRPDGFIVTDDTFFQGRAYGPGELAPKIERFGFDTEPVWTPETRAYQRVIKFARQNLLKAHNSDKYDLRYAVTSFIFHKKSRVSGARLAKKTPSDPSRDRKAEEYFNSGLVNTALAINLKNVSWELDPQTGEQTLRGGFAKLREQLPKLFDEGVRKIYLGGIYDEDLAGAGQLPLFVHTGTSANTRYKKVGHVTVRVTNYQGSRREVRLADGRTITLVDQFGNIFSIPSMLNISPMMAEDPARAEEEFDELVQYAKNLNNGHGIEFIVDFIPWFNPAVLDSTNYKRFFYREIGPDWNAVYAKADASARSRMTQDLLEEPRNHGWCAAEVEDTGSPRIVLVRHVEGTNIDQILPNPYHPENRAYYAKVFEKHMARGIRDFRIDLGHLLLKINTRGYFEAVRDTYGFNLEDWLRDSGMAYSEDHPDGIKPGETFDHWWLRQRDIWDETLEKIYNKYFNEGIKATARSAREPNFIFETYGKRDRNEFLSLTPGKIYFDDLARTMENFLLLPWKDVRASWFESVLDEMVSYGQFIMPFFSNFDHNSIGNFIQRGNRHPRTAEALMGLLVVVQKLGPMALVDYRDWKGLSGLPVKTVGGNNPDDFKSFHPFSSAEDLDSAAVRVSPMEQALAAIPKDLRKAPVISYQILDNAYRDRFLSVGLRTVDGNWFIVVLDLKPGSYDESVQDKEHLWVGLPAIHEKPLKAGDFELSSQNTDAFGKNLSPAWVPKPGQGAEKAPGAIRIPYRWKAGEQGRLAQGPITVLYLKNKKPSEDRMDEGAQSVTVAQVSKKLQEKNVFQRIVYLYSEVLVNPVYSDHIRKKIILLLMADYHFWVRAYAANTAALRTRALGFLRPTTRFSVDEFEAAIRDPLSVVREFPGYSQEKRDGIPFDPVRARRNVRYAILWTIGHLVSEGSLNADRQQYREYFSADLRERLESEADAWSSASDQKINQILKSFSTTMMLGAERDLNLIETMRLAVLRQRQAMKDGSVNDHPWAASQVRAILRALNSSKIASIVETGVPFAGARLASDAKVQIDGFLETADPENAYKILLSLDRAEAENPGSVLSEASGRVRLEGTVFGKARLLALMSYLAVRGDPVLKEYSKNAYPASRTVLLIDAYERLAQGFSAENTRQRLKERLPESPASLVSLGTEVEVPRSRPEQKPLLSPAETAEAKVLSKILGVPLGRDGIIEYAFPFSTRPEDQARIHQFFVDQRWIPQEGDNYSLHLNLLAPPQLTHQQAEEAGFYISAMLGTLFVKNSRLAYLGRRSLLSVRLKQAEAPRAGETAYRRLELISANLLPGEKPAEGVYGNPREAHQRSMAYAYSLYSIFLQSLGYDLKTFQPAGVAGPDAIQAKELWEEAKKAVDQTLGEIGIQGRFDYRNVYSQVAEYQSGYPETQPSASMEDRNGISIPWEILAEAKKKLSPDDLLRIQKNLDGSIADILQKSGARLALDGSEKTRIKALQDLARRIQSREATVSWTGKRLQAGLRLEIDPNTLNSLDKLSALRVYVLPEKISPKDPRAGEFVRRQLSYLTEPKNAGRLNREEIEDSLKPKAGTLGQLMIIARRVSEASSEEGLRWIYLIDETQQRIGYSDIDKERVRNDLDPWREKSWELMAHIVGEMGGELAVMPPKWSVPRLQAKHDYWDPIFRAGLGSGKNIRVSAVMGDEEFFYNKNVWFVTGSGARLAKKPVIPDSLQRLSRELNLVNLLYNHADQTDVKPNVFWDTALVVFGSARIMPGSFYYEEAVRLGYELAMRSHSGRTGAGPSIMEAIPKGMKLAQDEAAGRNMILQAERQGIRILLPFEQYTNTFINRVENFEFFLTRKLALHENIFAAVAFPGGYGTLDEIFEVWRRRKPFILYGSEFWTPLIKTFYQSWKEGGLIDVVDRRGVRPIISDKVDQVLDYALSELNIQNPYRTEEKRMEHVNAELIQSTLEIEKFPKSITLVGRSGDRQGRELNEIRKLTAELISKVPVRVASRGPLFDTVFSAANKQGSLRNMQAVLLTPSSVPLSGKENRVKNVIHVDSESNHQYLTAKNSHAYIFVPGGVGTMNKLFDILQLMQTDKMVKKPIILMGSEFWGPIKTQIMSSMLRRSASQDSSLPNLISPGDENLLIIVDTADEAIEALSRVIPAGTRLASSRKTLAYLKDEAFLNVLMNPRQSPLDEREREVLANRFNLRGRTRESLEELGKRFGVGREIMRREEREGLMIAEAFYRSRVWETLTPEDESLISLDLKKNGHKRFLRKGIYTVGQISGFSAEALKGIRHMGSSDVSGIQEALRLRGLSLRALSEDMKALDLPPSELYPLESRGIRSVEAISKLTRTEAEEILKTNDLGPHVLPRRLKGLGFSFADEARDERIDSLDLYERTRDGLSQRGIRTVSDLLEMARRSGLDEVEKLASFRDKTLIRALVRMHQAERSAGARLAVSRDVSQSDKAKLQSPADDQVDLKATLDVCSVLVGYNLKTHERVMAHFLPTGHLSAKYSREMANYLEDMLSDIPRDPAASKDWRFKIVSMDAPWLTTRMPGQLTSITPDIIRGYLNNRHFGLLKEQVIRKEDVDLMDSTGTKVARKKVSFSFDGKLTIHYLSDENTEPETRTVDLLENTTGARLARSDDREVHTVDVATPQYDQLIPMVIRYVDDYLKLTDPDAAGKNWHTVHDDRTGKDIFFQIRAVEEKDLLTGKPSKNIYFDVVQTAVSMELKPTLLLADNGESNIYDSGKPVLMDVAQGPKGIEVLGVYLPIEGNYFIKLETFEGSGSEEKIVDPGQPGALLDATGRPFYKTRSFIPSEVRLGRQSAARLAFKERIDNRLASLDKALDEVGKPGLFMQEQATQALAAILRGRIEFLRRSFRESEYLPPVIRVLSEIQQIVADGIVGQQYNGERLKEFEKTLGRILDEMPALLFSQAEKALAGRVSPDIKDDVDEALIEMEALEAEGVEVPFADLADMLQFIFSTMSPRMVSGMARNLDGLESYLDANSYPGRDLAGVSNNYRFREIFQELLLGLAESENGFDRLWVSYIQNFKNRPQAARLSSAERYIDILNRLNPDMDPYLQKYENGGNRTPIITNPLRYQAIYRRILEWQEYSHKTIRDVLIVGPGVQTILSADGSAEETSYQPVEMAAFWPQADVTVIDFSQRALKAVETSKKYTWHLMLGKFTFREAEKLALILSGVLTAESASKLMNEWMNPSVLTLDIDPEKIKDRIHLFRAPLENVDYGDQRLDILVATYSLYYQLIKMTPNESVGILGRMVRALRPGGVLFIDTKAFYEIGDDPEMVEKDLKEQYGLDVKIELKNHVAILTRSEQGARLAKKSKDISEDLAKDRTAPQVLLYPKDAAEAKDLAGYKKSLDAEFGSWTRERAAKASADLFQELDKKMRDYAQVRGVPKNYSNNLLHYTANMNMLLELIRRLEVDKAQLLSASGQYAASEQVDNPSPASREIAAHFFQTGKGLEKLKPSDIFKFFHGIDGDKIGFTHKLLLGLSKNPDGAKELSRLLQNADEKLARISQWDFLNRFPGASGITAVSGADDDRWDDAREEGENELKSESFFTYIPDYALTYANAYDNEPVVVVADIPVRAFRHSSWIFSTEGFEAELKVKGRIFIKKIFFIDRILEEQKEFMGWVDFRDAYLRSLEAIVSRMNETDRQFEKTGTHRLFIERMGYQFEKSVGRKHPNRAGDFRRVASRALGSYTSNYNSAEKRLRMIMIEAGTKTPDEIGGYLESLFSRKTRGARLAASDKYVDVLTQINPNIDQYLRKYQGDKNRTSSFTIPLRYVGIYQRMLEWRESAGRDVKNILIVGAGVDGIMDQEHRFEETSYQPMEMAAFWPEADVTVIDSSRGVLRVVENSKKYTWYFIPGQFALAEAEKMVPILSGILTPESADRLQREWKASSQLRLDIDREKVKDRIHTFEAPLESVDYGSQQLDVILATYSLYYQLSKMGFDQRIEILKRMISALRPGGALFVDSTTIKLIAEDPKTITKNLKQRFGLDVKIEILDGTAVLTRAETGARLAKPGKITPEAEQLLKDMGQWLEQSNVPPLYAGGYLKEIPLRLSVSGYGPYAEGLTVKVYLADEIQNNRKFPELDPVRANSNRIGVLMPSDPGLIGQIDISAKDLSLRDGRIVGQAYLVKLIQSSEGLRQVWNGRTRGMGQWRVQMLKYLERASKELGTPLIGAVTLKPVSEKEISSHYTDSYQKVGWAPIGLYEPSWYLRPNKYFAAETITQKALTEEKVFWYSSEAYTEADYDQAFLESIGIEPPQAARLAAQPGTRVERSVEGFVQYVFRQENTLLRKYFREAFKRARAKVVVRASAAPSQYSHGTRICIYGEYDASFSLVFRSDGAHRLAVDIMRKDAAPMSAEEIRAFEKYEVFLYGKSAENKIPDPQPVRIEPQDSSRERIRFSIPFSDAFLRGTQELSLGFSEVKEKKTLSKELSAYDNARPFGRFRNPDIENIRASFESLPQEARQLFAGSPTGPGLYFNLNPADGSWTLRNQDDASPEKDFYAHWDPTGLYYDDGRSVLAVGMRPQGPVKKDNPLSGFSFENKKLQIRWSMTQDELSRDLPIGKNAAQAGVSLITERSFFAEAGARLAEPLEMTLYDLKSDLPLIVEEALIQAEALAGAAENRAAVSVAAIGVKIGLLEKEYSYQAHQKNEIVPDILEQIKKAALSEEDLFAVTVQKGVIVIEVRPGARLASAAASVDFSKAEPLLRELAREKLRAGNAPRQLAVNRAGEVWTLRRSKDKRDLLVVRTGRTLRQVDLSSKAVENYQRKSQDLLVPENDLSDKLFKILNANGTPAVISTPSLNYLHLDGFTATPQLAAVRISNFLFHLDKRSAKGSALIFAGSDGITRIAEGEARKLGLQNITVVAERPEAFKDSPAAHLGVQGYLTAELKDAYPSADKWLSLEKDDLSKNIYPVFALGQITNILQMVVSDPQGAYAAFSAANPQYKLPFADFERLIAGDPQMALQFPLGGIFKIDWREAARLYVLSRVIGQSA